MEAQRLDKWLWFARFCKHRPLAAELAEGGRLRVNGRPVAKASATVRPGDVLTFPLGRYIRVVRVLGLAERRGPAEAAQRLYEDLAPPDPAEALPPQVAARPAGSGRPSKRDRRALDRLASEG